MKKKSSTVAFDKNGIATFPKRLKELIGDESLRKFGQAVGISEGGLRKYLPPGTSKPTFDKLVAIARYRGVNLEWLATGKGPRTAQLQQESDYFTVEKFEEQIVIVPGYQALEPSKCGDLSQSEPFRKKYLDYKKLDPSKVAVVFATSDAMNGTKGTIKNDDSLLVDLNSTKPLDGKIFIIKLGDEIHPRRIQKGVDGSITLICDNEEFSNQVLREEQVDDLVIIGQVIRRSTDL